MCMTSFETDICGSLSILPIFGNRALMFLNVLCFEIDFDSSLILTPCCKPSYLSLEDVSFG